MLKGWNPNLSIVELKEIFDNLFFRSRVKNSTLHYYILKK